MIIKTDKPLIFFDLETTGTELTSRIIQIAAIKFVPVNGLINFPVIDQTFRAYVHPGNGISIPEVATAVHGICDKDVSEAPFFKDISKELWEFLYDCDLAGFNILNFDVPVLAEHFAQCGFEFPIANTRFIDSSVIFRKHFPRTLAAAYKTYTGKDMSEFFNAHDAMEDSKVTVSVLEKQIAEHFNNEADIKSLNEVSLDGRIIVDPAGKFSRDKDGDIIFTFGSNKDSKVSTNLGMLDWMLKKDFPETTKRICREILKGELK